MPFPYPRSQKKKTAGDRRYSRELNSSDGIQEIVCDLWRALTGYSAFLWTDKKGNLMSLRKV